MARMLRQFAEQHPYDTNREIFLATAMALERRAHFLAAAPDGEAAGLEHDAALHAPINRLA